MDLERLYSEQVCPACGYQLDFRPWSGGKESEKACPCCGIHFGHDDARTDKRDAVYRAWRLHWIGLGKRWWSKQQQPPDFNPDEQLERLEQLAGEPPEWPGSD